MDQENFDRLLLDVIEEAAAGEILAVPGVAELLSEHFNNEIIDMWDREKENG